ncbi:MAG: ABC transporter permease [Clostridia bacterium]|nr:ABC transporter permease [Clostridia bacterium]
MKKHSSKTTALLNAPYALWSAVFIIVPLFFVAYYSFFRDGSFTLEYIGKFTEKNNLSAFWLSVVLSVLATVISLVIAYPFSYFLSRLTPSSQKIQMVLIMLPMWMNMLVRTYSWSNILETNGIVNKILSLFGIAPLTMLGSKGAVVLGMVYNYLPYMILPIYTAMTKIDKPLLDAADDLGCTPWEKLKRVIMPLSVPGVISGIIMVFVPSISTFYISQRMSNGNIVLIGDVIETQIKEYYADGGLNVGAAMSFVLMVIILICTFIMNKFSDEDNGGMVV